MIEEGRALVVEEAVRVLLVRAARVSEVAELERRRSAAPPGVVVDADRLLRREQVVGPATLEQKWGGRPTAEAEALVEAVDLVRDRPRIGPVGLSGLHAGVPGGKIGAAVRARRRSRRSTAVDAGFEPEREQAVVVALFHDPGRIAAHGRARLAAVEIAAVREQRVHEVRPRPAWIGGAERERSAGGAPPGSEAAIRLPDPVAEVCQLDALASAVGDSGDADGRGIGDMLVDQAPEQELAVSGLPALVGQVDVAPVGEAVRGGCRALLLPARATEPARRVVDHRIAALGEVGRRSTAIRRTWPTMWTADRWTSPPGPSSRGRPRAPPARATRLDLRRRGPARARRPPLPVRASTP